MVEISLSNARYVELLEAERRLSEITKEYDKAEECGINCSPLRQIKDVYTEQITAIKKNYAPSKVRQLVD
jgi:hypothetical protein